MTRHVVLLTYGEPPTPAFLPQLKYSWRILLGLTRSVAAIPAPLIPMIALTRARMRSKLWTQEKYGSPLEPITREQGVELQSLLSRRGGADRWRVHLAYEFRDPLLLDRLAMLPVDEPIDVVPMYVADSAFTHQLARDTIAVWAARAPRRPEPIRIRTALDESAVIEASAAHVRREIGKRGAGGAGWALVLAAHGTLLEPQKPIETGRIATERIAAGIAEKLRDRFDRIQLGWLNHVYGGRWTEPAADVALRELSKSGIKKIVYFPFGFLADNAESELEGRVALRAVPDVESIHLPCLNVAPELLAAIADQLTGAAPEPEPVPEPAGKLSA
jgi:protoheme ferro-lyase